MEKEISGKHCFDLQFLVSIGMIACKFINYREWSPLIRGSVELVSIMSGKYNYDGEELTRRIKPDQTELEIWFQLGSFV